MSKSFKEIETRLKKAFDAVTDTELAQVLGMPRNAYASRKKRASIPYGEIVIACVSRNISLDWLFDNQASLPVASTIVGDNSVNVRIGDGNQIVIGAKDFADAGEAAEIVKNLRFAPKPYLDALLVKLLQFREMTKA